MASDDNRKEIDQLLREEARDPMRLENFLDTWNAMTDAKDARSSLMLSRELDHDVDNALHSLEKSDDWLMDAAALKSKMAAFPHPAMLVRDDGMIISINDAAFERLSVEPGQGIDTLPVNLADGREISDEVHRALGGHRNRHGLNFIPAVDALSDRSLMLTILRHDNPAGDNRFTLVIVVDPFWSIEYKRLFVEAYGLTEAEAEVLIGFLNGQSSEQIAHARGRSHLTVKTQFQSIMSKSGTTTQADLMRLSLALGQFGRDITEVAELASHPHRRHFEIPGPGGRKIEFYLTGDPCGQPILYVPDITLITFPAKIETALQRAGLCIASVLRPGCGLTDPASGLSMREAIAQDLAAVARQLGWNKSAILFHSTSCHFAPSVSSFLRDRISRVLLLSVPTPPPYLQEFAEAAPWLISMARARDSSPKMFQLIVTAGIMGWRALGTKRFASMQLRSNAKDVEELHNPDSLREMDRAMRLYFSQSTDEILADSRRIFADWNSDWRDDAPRVHVLQGDSEPTASIVSIRRLVDDHSAFMTLEEVEGAGFMLPATDLDRLVAWLSDGALKPRALLR